MSFQEVSNAANADFLVGWGDFNTSSSNVADYTDIHRAGGLLLPGATVRLEDPNETQLVGSAGNQLTYAGMGATLYQMALHEIGHALGLQDVSDPNSVMYYSLGASNQTLDGTDIAAIQHAYLAPSITASSSDIAHLNQAMAVFGSHV